VNKRAIVQKIIESLVAELELYAQSARAAHADATHEQSKAENKYDTRGLEASYLARGQSRQAAETATARAFFESLELRDCGPETPIDLGALIELETRCGREPLERAFYFMGPKAGGTEVLHAKKSILVITPESPLGRQLTGKRKGDLFQFTMAGLVRDYRIISVW
jgi:hypothetical protein